MLKYLSRHFFLILLWTAVVGNRGALATKVYRADFQTDVAGFEVYGDSVEIESDDKVRRKGTPTLRITANGGQSQVRSPRFRIEPTHALGIRNGKNLVYWSVHYSIKAKLKSGSCHLSLRILDGDAPYEVPLEHFASAQSEVDGFTVIDKPLCAITSTHPNLRSAAGSRDAQVVFNLDDATGTVWVGNIEIATAQPGNQGFEEKDWEKFEAGDGKHCWIIMCNAKQPMYAREPDFASALVMDSALKLSAVAGWNMNREWIAWGQEWRERLDRRPSITNANPGVTPGGGNADYEESLNQLQEAVKNLKYYGIDSMLCIHGSPDWTHPRHKNSGDHGGYQNFGTRNGFGNTYPGPQYASENSIGNYWLYPPDDWQDWRDLAGALVAKLKGHHVVYEIINEINVATQGAVIGGYKAVYQWQYHFYDVAKSIDPDAQVLVGACDKMLAGLAADGILNYCDGVAYHGYSGNLEHTRGIVESIGTKKHIWMNEHFGLHPELRTSVRGQGKWTTFSVFRPTKRLNDNPLIFMTSAQGKHVYADDPKGLGDRLELSDEYSLSGDLAGKLSSQDQAGLGPDRILAEVLCEPQMEFDSSQKVILRATNNTNRTFTNVRFWPVGFVDNLGFDMKQIRAADATIRRFRPGAVHEIALQVTPRKTQRAAQGVYKIGLAIVNDQGKHSLVLKPLEIVPLVEPDDPTARNHSAAAKSDDTFRHLLFAKAIDVGENWATAVRPRFTTPSSGSLADLSKFAQHGVYIDFETQPQF